MTKRTTLTMAAAALLVAAFMAPLPAAASQPQQVQGSAPAQTKTLRYEVDLERALDLRTALNATEYHGYPVVALRFENPQIVGEFSVNGSQSAKEFLTDFQNTYGTQPMVVAAIVEVPETQLKKLDRKVREADAGATRRSAAPAFIAPPADQRKVEALFASHREAEQRESALGSTLVGGPKYGEFEIYRPSTSIVRFTQFYSWSSGNRPTQLDSRYGLEFEVNIRTAAAGYQTGTRPSCLADYKRRPFAANQNWTWSALVNSGSGLSPVASAVGAYADYNDASNECNLNSMAIGLRTPQALPANPSGITEALFTIDAPRGLDNTGVVHGLVQSVNESWCLDFPVLSNTDCMGVAAGSVGVRPTLSEARKWTAPNLCWTSDSWGDAVPVKSTQCPLW